MSNVTGTCIQGRTFFSNYTWNLSYIKGILRRSNFTSLQNRGCDLTSLINAGPCPLALLWWCRKPGPAMPNCWDGGTVGLPKRAGWGRRANSANTSRNLLWPLWISRGKSPILSPHPTDPGKAAAICRNGHKQRTNFTTSAPLCQPSILLNLRWVPESPSLLYSRHCPIKTYLLES